MDFQKIYWWPRPVRIRLQGSEPGTVCQSFLGIKNAASYKTMRQIGGLEGDRTLDLSDANRTRSQLRYRPIKCLSVKSAFLIYNICEELSRAFSSVQRFFVLFICLCLSARCAAANGGSVKLRKRVGAEQSSLHTGKDICSISFSTRWNFLFIKTKWNNIQNNSLTLV